MFHQKLYINKLLFTLIACLNISLLHGTLLVTGGAGYIGSATVLYMLQKGYQVIVIDKKLPESSFFAHSHKITDAQALDALNPDTFGKADLAARATFIKADIADTAVLNKIFSTFHVEAVIHFAGYMEVGKSVKEPEEYYLNNVNKSLGLLECMRQHNLKNIIFSSSAAVYGLPKSPRILESDNKNPMNPYGKTKHIIEMALEDYAQAYQFKAVALRYFNAAGALPTYDIGERHDPETHVIPLLLRAAYASKPFSIFGNDYNTCDGTCTRDYLHIYDLAHAHYLALKYLETHDASFEAFNLGTGRGSTVKELIACAEKITGIKVNTVITPRRPGDPDCLIADTTKAHTLLKWQPTESSIEHIVATAHAFHTKEQKF